MRVAPTHAGTMSEVPSYMAKTKQTRQRKAEDAEAIARAKARNYKEKPAKGDYLYLETREIQKGRANTAVSKAANRARLEQERTSRENQSRALKQQVTDDRGNELRKACAGGSMDDVMRMVGETGDAAYPINHQSDDGLTPLMKASMYGQADIVTALLSAGAAVDLIEGHGRTALMLARCAIARATRARSPRSHAPAMTIHVKVSAAPEGYAHALEIWWSCVCARARFCASPRRAATTARPPSYVCSSTRVRPWPMPASSPVERARRMTVGRT